MRRFHVGFNPIGAAGLLGLALLSGAQAKAQQFHGLPNVEMQAPVVQDNSSTESRFVEMKRIKTLNEMRQKSLVSDTEKLLKLARELNTAAAPGHPPLTAAQRMKKLGQIEKLAKKVREKMSYAVTIGPSLNSQYTVFEP